MIRRDLEWTKYRVTKSTNFGRFDEESDTSRGKWVKFMAFVWIVEHVNIYLWRLLSFPPEQLIIILNDWSLVAPKDRCFFPSQRPKRNRTKICYAWNTWNKMIELWTWYDRIASHRKCLCGVYEMHFIYFSEQKNYYNKLLLCNWRLLHT